MKKILIQRADKMGDTVLALPVVALMKSAYPELRVDFLSSKIGLEVLVNDPLISKVWDSGQDNLDALLSDEKYDAVIHLFENVALSKLTKRIKIPMRVGTSESWPLRFCYTHKIKARSGDITQHTVLKNLAFLEPFKITPKLIRPTFTIDSEGASYIQTLKKKYVPTGVKLVCICLATGGSNQPIPLENISAFVSQLDCELYRVIFIGPPEFQETVSDIRQDGQRCLFVTKFNHSFAALAASQFYIGPDTGFTHIAAAFNIPSLVFSPMKSQLPSRWGSLSDNFEIIRKDYLCNHIAMQNCDADDINKQININVLTEEFNKIVDASIKKKKMTMAEVQLKHLKHSLRIILISTTRAEYNMQYEYAKTALAEGVHFFPLYLPLFSHKAFPILRRVVENKNISIIHGRIPLSWQLYLKFHMVIRLGYFAPKVVNHIDWNPQITPEEYLEIYKNVWQA